MSGSKPGADKNLQFSSLSASLKYQTTQERSNMEVPFRAKDIKNHFRDPLYRNSYYLMANTITGVGAGFLFWLFAARFYSPEEVGIATAIISAMNFLVIISLLGLNFSIIRYLPEEKEKSRLINTCVTLVSATSASIALIFILAVNHITPSLEILKEPIYMVLFVI
ncbi:MAG: oligosaccharide flippase family protein, partial [Euryarchaeota archaeon]|nr:oligosaccharide flippase family protein [Euryarchaeota archaeon]